MATADDSVLHKGNDFDNSNGIIHVTGEVEDAVVDAQARFVRGDSAVEEHLHDDSPVIDIHINNVVTNFNTRCHLNLRHIATEGMNVIYKRENGMLNMKLRRPETTASIWSSGKITCTGATSEEAGKIASKRIARRLQKMGYKVRFTCYRVVNVLGTCILPFGIRINAFSRAHPTDVSYEPEIHPGATYRLKNPKATLKVFSTGSITVTAPSVANVSSAIEHIYPLVEEFKMDRSQAVENHLLAKSAKCTFNKRGGSEHKNSHHHAVGCYGDDFHDEYIGSDEEDECDSNISSDPDDFDSDVSHD